MRGVSAVGAASLLGGCITAAIAVSPPLHELGERLFSAHMIEHELLMAVAAPLLVLGRPGHALFSLLPRDTRRRLARRVDRARLSRIWGIATAPLLACIVHTLALWLWHIPALFEAALQSSPLHAVQHMTFFGVALLYWSSLVANRHGAAGYGTAVLSLFATSLQCAFLGALLTVAGVPWYRAYPALEDQQFAGLVMWVPAGFVYTVAGITFVVAWLRQSEKQTRRWERRLI